MSLASELFYEGQGPFSFAGSGSAAIGFVYGDRSPYLGPKVVNSSEIQYLNLLRKIMCNGKHRGDRTGTGTISLFGEMMKFNLEDGFPLLTTKYVKFKNIAEELLWFLRGSTNAKELNAAGVKIWDENSSKEVLEKLGLDYKEGDIGPGYGFAWKHFGAEYKGMDHDYTGQGIDQISQIINTIKTNPNDRRMILTAWNPLDLKKMALPPCHLMAQFYVTEGRLDCMMTQRSGDMFIGVPYNIASYSLLMHIIANITGLKPGVFTHSLGDAHIYKNHVDQVALQYNRVPYKFPTLNIKRKLESIDDISIDDFEIVDYVHHPFIEAKMAV